MSKQSHDPNQMTGAAMIVRALIDHGVIARLGIAALLQDDALVVRGQLLPLIFGCLLRLPQRHLQGGDLAPGLAAQLL